MTETYMTETFAKAHLKGEMWHLVFPAEVWTHHHHKALDSLIR